jgi:hypothetical protein
MEDRMASKVHHKLVRRQVRWGEAEVAQELAALDASRLSVSAWARQTGIAASTLHRRRRRSDPGSAQEPQVFHEVRLKDQPAGLVGESAAFAGEVVAGRYVVRAPLGFDEAELRRLLLVVAGC